ncbi:DUF6240 domain-containing protein [Lachnoclostridium phytofermentans]|uniref:Uncharacterized protein n=1 Tax=Lachnoclostridium phytofermentans (strain ATCC 700394 / DSM 18823 / ISDg) TaxID=357809 RepID=A9KL49_LACP7|nr:DUF6240 domain-containing protein [Lachnoclostridium phytofermentans]ABX44198.1 hypothetical protein Cphy_3851 [Lachnoclostridium phytofermentans ISDg]
MNMNGIYATGNQQKNQVETISKESTNHPAYEVGQILEGTVLDVSDQISINFSGRECKFSKETVPDAKEGEIRKFKIMDVSKNGIVLKEIGSAEKQENKKEVTLLFTQVDAGKGTVSTFQNGETSVKEEEQDLKQTATCMTEDDYHELSEEGFTIEDFNQERLARALERIKSQKVLREDSLNAQKEIMKKTREMAEKVARACIPDTSMAKQIVDRLLNADLPVTAENVEQIANAMKIASSPKLAPSGNGLSENTMTYLIQNNLKPTIESIYKAEHSGNVTQKLDKEEAFRELEDAVKQILKEGDIPVKEETLQEAKWLFERNLPITSENIRYKMSLSSIKPEDQENMALTGAVNALKAGKDPRQGVLLSMEEDKFKDFIENIHQISEETIDKATTYLKNEKANNQSLDKLSLKFLMQIQNGEIKSDIEGANNLQVDADTNNIAAITAKRQLEEIRLKLTVEASLRLSAKGISVETESIAKVVEGLKQLEEEYYEKLGKEVGFDTSAQIDLLKQTVSTVDTLKQSSATVLSSTFTIRQQVSLNRLYDTSFGESEQLKNAKESYEQLMTSPRADMGDSIKKAFASVDSLLKEIQLDTTTANQRAVRILGYNNIEITQDNVLAMKAYDAKVSEVIEGLKPSVTASLIKDGVNPLTMNLDELSSTLKEYLKDNGTDSTDGFAKFLVELEANEEISPPERESYIGIYRLLHQIQKSDGAAIGAVVKAGGELTLKNLLTSVRTLKHGSMDERIDDDFRSLTKATGYSNSITAQIDAAFYGEKLVREIQKEITPDALKEVMSSSDTSVFDSNLEELSEKLTKVQGQVSQNKIQNSLESEKLVEESLNKEDLLHKTNIHESNQLEQIREISNNSNEELRFLKDYGLSNSIHNIAATKELLNQNDSIYKNASKYSQKKSIEELNKDIIDSIDNRETLVSSLEEFYHSFSEASDEVLLEAEVTANQVLEIKQLKSMIRLNQGLNKKEHYNIPLITKDSITNINLTVIHGTTNEGKVYISYPSNTFGTIQAELYASDENAKCFITVEDRAALENLKENQELLLEALKNQDISISSINIAIRSNTAQGYLYKSGKFYREAQLESATEKVNDNSLTPEATENKYNTEKLYLAAKTIIQSLQKLEVSNEKE